MSLKKVILLSAVTSLLAKAGKCPFGYDSQPKKDDQQMKRVLQETPPPPPGFDDPDAPGTGFDVKYPSDIITCSTADRVLTTDIETFTTDIYTQIATKIFSHMDETADQGVYAACLLRLAGHDFMDFRKGEDDQTSGGSDGCVNFEDDDNKGLDQCIAAIDVQYVYQGWCGQVSLADFIVIAAEAAMSKTATKFNADAPFAEGSLESKFRDNFRAGRTTLEECPDQYKLMPDAEKGCEDMKEIFIDNIYAKEKSSKRFRWKLTAAISGAHTLGMANGQNSGFQGTWSDEANQKVFNNDYYRSMLNKGWGPVEIDENHHQWGRVDLSNASSTEMEQMMLSSDMCLAYQFNSDHIACVDEKVAAGMNLNRANKKCIDKQRDGGFLNAAAGHNCCAWTHTKALFKQGILTEGEENDYCGTTLTDGFNFQGEKTNFQAARDFCCASEGDDSTGDCDSSKWPKGPAFNSILNFARSEKDWLKFYQKAWWIATTNGQEGLVNVVKYQKKMKRKRMEKRRADRKARRADRKAKMDQKKADKAKGRKLSANNFFQF